MSPKERKSKTEEILQSLNIPVNTWLPLIESEEEVRIRSAEDIGKRILILACLVALAFDNWDKEQVVDYFKKYDLWDSVSNIEKLLLGKESLDKKEKIDLYWQSEGIWLLLWTINKVDQLDLPDDTCDLNEIFMRLPEPWENPVVFLSTAFLRSTEEILDMSDLVYRLHWAARDAFLHKKDTPGNMDSGVISERHYTINWVTYYHEDWDEIATDT